MRTTAIVGAIAAALGMVAALIRGDDDGVRQWLAVLLLWMILDEVAA